MKKTLKGPMTVAEWVRTWGPQYRITTEEYVRRCCRQDRLATGFVCRLPHGWCAARWGRTWLITWGLSGRAPRRRPGPSSRAPRRRPGPSSPG